MRGPSSRASLPRATALAAVIPPWPVPRGRRLGSRQPLLGSVIRIVGQRIAWTLPTLAFMMA
eukprot:3419830-Alexandrium_andersonii.AAC.1